MGMTNEVINHNKDLKSMYSRTFTLFYKSKEIRRNRNKS
jgi:hypothetical protein